MKSCVKIPADLSELIGKILRDPNIPLQAKKEIRRANNIFIQNAAAYPEVALNTFAFGLIVGSYASVHDQAVMAEADRLLHSARQSSNRKDKTTVPTWHKHARALAITAHQDHPSLSQEAVAAEIHKNFPKGRGYPKRPEIPTLKAFVSSEERTGNLPRRTDIRKK